MHNVLCMLQARPIYRAPDTSALESRVPLSFGPGIRPPVESEPAIFNAHRHGLRSVTLFGTDFAVAWLFMVSTNGPTLHPTCPALFFPAVEGPPQKKRGGMQMFRPRRWACPEVPAEVKALCTRCGCAISLAVGCGRKASGAGQAFASDTCSGLRAIPSHVARRQYGNSFFALSPKEASIPIGCSNRVDFRWYSARERSKKTGCRSSSLIRSRVGDVERTQAWFGSRAMCPPGIRT